MTLGERQAEIPWMCAMLNHYAIEGKSTVLDVGSAGTEMFEFKRLKLPLIRVDRLYIAPDDYSHMIITEDIRRVTLETIGEPVDIITVISSLEHMGLECYGSPADCEDPIAEQKNIFAHCMSLLKPDGICLLTLPFGKYEHGGWYIVYTWAMLLNLISDYKIDFIDAFTLDKRTWVYSKIDPQLAPDEGCDWPRTDFSRATSVACVVVRKS